MSGGGGFRGERDLQMQPLRYRQADLEAMSTEKLKRLEKAAGRRFNAMLLLEWTGGIVGDGEPKWREAVDYYELLTGACTDLLLDRSNAKKGDG